MAALIATALVPLDCLYAGCHYPEAHGHTGSTDQDDPDGDARHLKFVGRWIYEGGQFKYVPWHGEPPCQGPNCRADDDRPLTTTGSSNTTLKRLSPMTLTIAWQAPNRFDALSGCLACSNLFPISGYPHQYEYPP